MSRGSDRRAGEDRSGGERGLTEEEKARAWIEHHVRESPPFSDAQLKRMGEILGVVLTRKTSTPA
jgi:hypothetical protein